MHPIPDDAPLVLFDRVTKHFGGTIALSAVSMQVRQGEIVALLGENGAGKSTLIKMLAGIHDPDEGAIYYRGHPYRHCAARHGAPQPVAFIHQDLGLIEWMTIAENMALTLGYPRKRALIDWLGAWSKRRKHWPGSSATSTPGAVCRS